MGRVGSGGDGGSMLVEDVDDVEEGEEASTFMTEEEVVPLDELSSLRSP